MREYINTNDMKEMAERLSRSLSWCHNMLRSQEKMTSESAFRELTKLLYIKYITENIPEEREEMKSFLKGAGQIYPDQKFEHLFDEVKKVFDGGYKYPRYAESDRGLNQSVAAAA